MTMERLAAGDILPEDKRAVLIVAYGPRGKEDPARFWFVKGRFTTCQAWRRRFRSFWSDQISWVC